MRPTPVRQYSVWPTGCACQAVRAPGVKVTTEPPRRDGELAVITGSWNTTPVKVSAAPRLVVRSPARTTPALTGMASLLALNGSADNRRSAPGGAISRTPRRGARRERPANGSRAAYAALSKIRSGGAGRGRGARTAG